MKSVCIKSQESRRRRRHGWRGVALVAILMGLLLYPIRGYAAISNSGTMPDTPGMSADAPAGAMPGTSGMPSDAPAGGAAADAPDAMAFPGLTTDTFGPSPITAQGVLTLVVCIAFLCGGMTFCVFFRRGRKSF